MTQNSGSRDFFVGDLHGHFEPLKKLLDFVDFTPGKDRLWSVGDFTDRGTETKECIDFFRNTEGCEAVLGNHDAMFIISLQEILDDEYTKDSEHWLQRYGLWIKHHTRGELKEMSAWLQTLPLSREFTLANGKTAGLVHAELPQGFGFENELSWNRDSIFDPVAVDPTALCLLLRDRAMEARRLIRAHQEESPEAVNSQLKINISDIQPHIDDRVDWVVSGHTPFFDPALPVVMGNHVFLDTLIYEPRGALTLAELNSGEFFQISNSGDGLVSRVCPIQIV